MKTERPILATLAFATLFSLASPRPNDLYRRAPNEADKKSPESQQRHAWTRTARRRRGYSPWMVGDDPYGGFDNYPPWRPEVLGPAYVIPVYPPSHSNKRPYHSRRRPIDVNPGIPPDNPIKTPYRGPSYLPPRKPTPSTTTTITTTSKPTPSVTTTNTTSKTPSTTEATKIGNRFNDDDDRPIWGGSEVISASGVVAVVPTRPPRPPNMQDVPPLLHILGMNPMNPLSLNDKETGEEDLPHSTARSVIPTTTATRRTPTATNAPRPGMPSGPTDCVWAVVSCCSAASVNVVETCFEERGCPGPFWDNSPCDSDFARAAIASALKFYNQ